MFSKAVVPSMEAFPAGQQIDVDFARECEKTDRRHPPSEFGPRVTKSPNGFSPPSRIWTLPYYTCMITPRILPEDCVSSSKSVNLKAV